MDRTLVDITLFPIANQDDDLQYTEDEQMDFFRNLMCSLDRHDSLEKAEKIYGDLLKCNKVLSDSELVFVINYTVYKKLRSIKYDSNGNVKPGYEGMEFPKINLVFDDPTSVLGFYQSNQKENYSINLKFDGFTKLLLSSETMNKRVMYELIHVINHEMTHYKQEYDAYAGLMTSSFFNYITCILAKKYSTEFFDEYSTNYAYKSLEAEAELDSLRDTIEYINKYLENPNSLKRYSRLRRNRLKEKYVAYQLSTDYEYILRDEYNVKCLILSVKEDKNLLVEFPQLRQFFEADGTLKSEGDLLKGFSRSDDDTKKVYIEFFNYLYGLGDYRDVTTDLSPDLKEIKYDVIKELLIKESKYYCSLENTSSTDLMRMSGFGLAFRKEKFLELRSERIKNYGLFLHVYKLENKLEEVDLSRAREVDECIGIAEGILKLNQIFETSLDGSTFIDDGDKDILDDLSSSIAVSENKHVEDSELSKMFRNDDVDFKKSILEPKNRHIN